MVERAIQDAQAQMRTVKMALEWRYGGENIREDHPILPWLVRYPAMFINLARQGEDGRSAYERRMGKRYLRELPDMGEFMCYLKPESRGVEKADTRWGDGIYVGIREESNEILVATNKGVIKVMSYKRRPEENRWDRLEFEEIKGIPWEPIQGRSGIEVKSRVEIPGEKQPVTMDEGILLRPKWEKNVYHQG